MGDTLRLSVLLDASPEEIYRAWLSSDDHSEFTGGEAKIDAQVGGKFTAWDGYIVGSTLELQPYSRIVQAWRTTEFPENSPDSRLELNFEPVDGQTRLILIHSDIPAGQEEEYKQGWLDYYFEPMEKYFSSVKQLNSPGNHQETLH